MGECRGRVVAGSFHDRWLAEAMAIVSLRPELLNKVRYALPFIAPFGIRVLLDSDEFGLVVIKSFKSKF